MMSPFEAAMPLLTALALPALAWVINRTRESSAKALATMALVSSFEPSSMTMTSMATPTLASTRRTEFSITRASL